MEQVSDFSVPERVIEASMEGISIESALIMHGVWTGLQNSLRILDQTRIS
jgi:hypothetical protein